MIFEQLVAEPIPAPASIANQPTAAAAGLGSVGELHQWACAVTQPGSGERFHRPRLVIVTGDHPTTAAQVSAHPPDWGKLRAQALIEGAGAVSRIAASYGIGVRVLSPPFPSEAMDTQDAADDAAVVSGFELGMSIADEEIDQGADLILLGDVGHGSTLAASVLISVLTGTEPLKTLACGSAPDDATWMRRMSAVRDARWRAWPAREEPMQLLRTVGGADLAALAGIIYRAALRRTPLILDGVVSAAAALLVARLDPAVTGWLCAGSLSADTGHELALGRLGITPVLQLGLGVGEGLGALLGYGVLHAAMLLPDAPEKDDSAHV